MGGGGGGGGGGEDGLLLSEREVTFFDPLSTINKSWRKSGKKKIFLDQNDTLDGNAKQCFFLN